jgi:hypothetical protein
MLHLPGRRCLKRFCHISAVFEQPWFPAWRFTPAPHLAACYMHSNVHVLYRQRRQSRSHASTARASLQCILTAFANDYIARDLIWCVVAGMTACRGCTLVLLGLLLLGCGGCLGGAVGRHSYSSQGSALKRF